MNLRRLTTNLLALYAFLTAVVMLRAALGLPFLRGSTELLALLAFIFAGLHAGLRLGWKPALLLLLLSTGVSLAFESVGVATGWIYGPYHYSDLLGPKFLGLVPYLIPVAWFMMMYPSYVIAAWLVPARQPAWRRWVLLAAVGALAMTAWDLVMDPMMVAIGHWVWEIDGAYFGVPLQNFWGWWLTTFTVFALFLAIRRAPGSYGPASASRGDTSFDRLALLSYAITGLGNIVSAGLVEMWGAALVGVFAMLPWVILAGWRMGEAHA